MPRRSVKKIQGRPELEPGEEVIDAIYGLGKGLLKLTDLASGVGQSRPWSGTADDVTDDPAGSEAARIDRSGIIALTDRRLLFFPARTAVTKPTALGAAWHLDKVMSAALEKDILVITFADGSVGGLHTGRLGRDIADAVNRRIAS
jgi:hypothetical protein